MYIDNEYKIEFEIVSKNEEDQHEAVSVNEADQCKTISNSEEDQCEAVYIDGEYEIEFEMMSKNEEDLHEAVPVNEEDRCEAVSKSKEYHSEEVSRSGEENRGEENRCEIVSRTGKVVCDSTLPNSLEMKPSNLRGAAMGVFTLLKIENNFHFGPYVGERLELCDEERAFKSEHSWLVGYQLEMIFDILSFIAFFFYLARKVCFVSLG